MSIKIDSSIQMPISGRPIFIIGAGAIVRDAHLPAYKKANWPVEGIYDPDQGKAAFVAKQYNIPKVFESLQSLLESAPDDSVFDVAVPASALHEILPLIPVNACVLIQKPFGENLEQAKHLLAICRSKKFTAGVNFQMKFIPSVIAAKKLIDAGTIGHLHDMEIRMNIAHPWQLWPFLFGIPRMEMLYHSIHYIDLLKYFFGMPKTVYAKTWQHPKQMQLASTRSIIMLDYDKPIKAHINTNHGHEFGIKYQDSFIKWEGTHGAIRSSLGLNINFPEGIEDKFEFVVLEEGNVPEWKEFKLEGSWYPDAFVGSMADLLCYAEGSSKKMITSVDEAYRTMQLVEAAYLSSESGGTPIPENF